jgi:hypothetical protein
VAKKRDGRLREGWWLRRGMNVLSRGMAKKIDGWLCSRYVWLRTGMVVKKIVGTL